MEKIKKIIVKIAVHYHGCQSTTERRLAEMATTTGCANVGGEEDKEIVLIQLTRGTPL